MKFLDLYSGYGYKILWVLTLAYLATTQVVSALEISAIVFSALAILKTHYSHFVLQLFSRLF